SIGTVVLSIDYNPDYYLTLSYNEGSPLLPQLEARAAYGERYGE
ncbi:unnamed protein product, partial [Allacma fusca]